MGINGSYSLNWYIITSSMGICFFVAFSCIVLQYKSTQHFWDKLKCTQPFIDIIAIREIREATAKQSLLLYFVYIGSGLCALNCFLCHISSSFPMQFCQYGMAICVVIYATAKTFVYGYLLERAVHQNINNPILPLFILKKVFPIYLCIYWLIYAISCPVYFRGTPADPANEALLTACKFDKFWPELFITSSILDVIHWIVLTFLFLAPTLRDIKLGNSQTLNNKESIELFISQMNIHILCTFICSMSSTIFMIIMSEAKTFPPEYIWFGGNIDMMINCVASFTTIPANRDYIMEKIFCSLCCRYCCYNGSYSSYSSYSSSYGCPGNIMQCKWCCGLLITYLISNVNHQQSVLMEDSTNNNGHDLSLNDIEEYHDNECDNDNNISNIEMRIMKQQQHIHRNGTTNHNHDYNNQNHQNNHINHINHINNNDNDYDEPLMLNDTDDNNEHRVNTVNANTNTDNNGQNNDNNNNNNNSNNHRRSAMFNLLMT